MPTTICPLPYIGPTIQIVKQERNTSSGRKLYTHQSNLTPSMDNHVIDPDFRSSKTLLERIPKGPIKQAVSATEYKALKASSEQTKLFKEQIALAAQNRIAAFYQQLVVTYKTGLHFAVGKTFDQGASALTCQLTNGRKPPITMKMDGSHTSTIPCLYAYPRQADGTPDLEQGVVYLKESDAYRFWNTTIDLPKHFNLGVDANIDKELRDEAIKILNQNALIEKLHDDDSEEIKGPEFGLFCFLDQFITLIRSRLERFKEQLEYNPANAKKLQAQITGLKLYKKELIKIENALSAESNSFDAYLNIQVDSQEITSNQETIYQIRYEAIQKNLSHQSKLIAKIEAAKQRILPNRLAYADTAFKELLLENCVNELDKMRIAKLYNMPKEVKEDKSSRRLGINASKEQILAHEIKINKHAYSGARYMKSLAKRIHEYMQTIRIQEKIERGSTLKKLRKMRGYTRKELDEIIKQHFPFSSAIQPTILELETGKKTMTSDHAEQISLLLKVDPVLFVPQFFNE